MMDNIAALPPPDKASALRWKSGLIAASCAALGVSRASLHRRIALQKNPRLPRLRPKPARALSQSETGAILDVLRSARFADQAPAEIYASLLDEGTYLCSIRTMYRILAGAKRGPRAPPGAAPHGLRKARAARHRPQPGLVLSRQCTCIALILPNSKARPSGPISISRATCKIQHALWIMARRCFMWVGLQP